jgi:hypothetical protein
VRGSNRKTLRANGSTGIRTTCVGKLKAAEKLACLYVGQLDSGSIRGKQNRGCQTV